MKIQLTVKEARVIGCLLEKQITTPEQYPLSLNSLTTACNQKTNREPVVEWSEADVQDTVDALLKKRLLRDLSGFGNRVVKYEHRFCNSEFGNLKLSAQELALVCVLLLRGPQTAGELRTRTARLAEFSDVQQVEAVLEKLAARDDGPFVMRLAREPGKRECRYAQLFCIDDSLMADSAESTATVDTLGDPVRVAEQESRIQALEDEVAALREQLAALDARLSALE
ncbi:DUF480 domain-containing protein [Plesiomonas shigelloides]|uniref:YceH family protein n=1 Tax=Plesiomonas shigelloides TaxID=703 RepID=UPI001C0571FF|nr:DUF480 domain-containing protein [Plesiomonas shigelloides]QWK98023.1 DUF480 domain-containing protein [Plesiomonas shigelloides]